MTKVAEYKASRTQLSVYSIGVGFLIGIDNAFFHPIDLSLAPNVIVWLIAAILSVVLLHEGVHATVALLLGNKPIFGIQPPLVYVTFNEKIPKGQFCIIALAPLVILDTVFGFLLTAKILRSFSYFCLIINTLGSVGDIWMTLKLIPHKSGTLVQDTKTGMQIWSKEPVNGGPLTPS